MSVITLTRGSTTFVASSRPPMPTSSTARSTFSRAKCSNAIAVIISKKLGCHGNSAMLHQLLRNPVHFTMQRRKIIVTDLFAVHPDALVDPHQMRRGIQPRLQSRSPQDRSQRSRRRALSIRARDQHARETPLRMIQPLQQAPAYAPDRTCAKASAPVRARAQTCAPLRFRRT